MELLRSQSFYFHREETLGIGFRGSQVWVERHNAWDAWRHSVNVTWGTRQCRWPWNCKNIEGYFKERVRLHGIAPDLPTKPNNKGQLWVGKLVLLHWHLWTFKQEDIRDFFLLSFFSFKPRSERSQRKTSRRNLIFSSCPSWAHRRKWYNFHATDISSLYMFINYLTLFQLLEGTTRARFCNAGNLNHRRPRRFSQELTDKFAQRKEKGETNFKYEEKKPPISRTRTMFRSWN